MGHKFDVMSTGFLSPGILGFFLSRKLFRNARGTFTPSCPLILVRHYMNILLTHIYRASFDLDDRSDFSDSPRHEYPSSPRIVLRKKRQIHLEVSRHRLQRLAAFFKIYG
jgi:hypothetical protein